MPYAFSIIGGDARLSWLAQSLTLEGHIVKIYGQEESEFPFDTSIIHCCDLDTALDGCHACILGMPCTRDGDAILAPTSRHKITFQTLFAYLTPNQLLCGGMIPKTVNHPKLFDYATDESLLLYNAIPTAEGALQLLMEHTPYVIQNTKIAMLGFGRIGQKTAQLLSAVSAIVDVYARKKEALASAQMLGFQAVNLYDIAKSIQDYDVVINTIPYPILSADILENANPKTILMELASNPGGFDLPTIQRNKLLYIDAKGLPGKVAPQSAAKYIQNAILNHMEDLK